MKTTTFSLFRKYEIKCKQFVPEIPIKRIIIGVHGFAGDKDSSVLSRLAHECEPDGTSLICFDFPVHGESPVDETELNADNCKKDLLFVFSYAKEQYPEAEICIFATSFGGFITLLCADKLKDVPLVLRAPAVTMPKVLVENVLKTDVESFRKAKYLTCGFERKMTLPFSFYEDLLEHEKKISRVITNKVCIIHGTADDIVPLEDVVSFSERCDNITLRLIEGADHRFKKDGELDRVIAFTKEFLNI